MRIVDMETIQGYFDALDTNKWLLFMAMNQEQVDRSRRFEANVINVLKDIVAPLPIA